MEIGSQMHYAVIRTMDVERRIRKLETTLSLLVDYINRYNVGIDDHHLQLLSLRRLEALL